MIEISLNKIVKSYGFNKILDEFSLEIKTGEIITFVGENGCGKSTILNINHIYSITRNITSSSLVEFKNTHKKVYDGYLKVQEKFSDRDDVYAHDTKEEQLSLADRFGITISFFAPNQKEFLNIVDGIVKTRGLEVDEQYLHSEALKWEKWHNGRSPRSAKQFINWLEGELQRKSEDK